MNRIIVNILEFKCILFSHVEIALKQLAAEGGKDLYLCMDRWGEPKKPNNDGYYYNKHTYYNDKKVTLEIETEDSIQDIAIAWARHLNQAGRPNLLTSNCADGVKWFLDRYDIADTSCCAMPVTCDSLCFGVYLPSFLQCCSVPARMMKLAESATHLKSSHHSGFFDGAISVLDQAEATPAIEAPPRMKMD